MKGKLIFSMDNASVMIEKRIKQNLIITYLFLDQVSYLSNSYTCSKSLFIQTKQTPSQFKVLYKNRNYNISLNTTTIQNYKAFPINHPNQTNESTLMRTTFCC